MATSERIPIDEVLTEISFMRRNAELSQVARLATAGSSALALLLANTQFGAEIRESLGLGLNFLGVVNSDGDRFLNGIDLKDERPVEYNPGEIYLRAAPAFGIRGELDKADLDQVADTFINLSQNFLYEPMVAIRQGMVYGQDQLLPLVEDYRRLSTQYLMAAVQSGVEMRGMRIPAYYQGRWVTSG
jgi:hypothetical protein